MCLTAFFVVQTALQACSRTVYAFSRDHGLPDGGYFGHVSRITTTPLRAIWFVTVCSILPGLLDLASPVAANAIFATLPTDAADRIRERVRFYDWDRSRGEVRWMTAWDTTEEDVDGFVAAVREELGRG